jgi:4-hydroxybenzoate polyprenyltransferase
MARCPAEDVSIHEIIEMSNLTKQTARDASILVVNGIRRVGALVRAMRVRHWLKNGFVVAPALFSGHLFDPPVLARAMLTALGFSLAASAVYLLNDVLDRKADRVDPIKCQRPVASGELSVNTALVSALLLAGVAVGGSFFLGINVLLALVAYLLLNVLYSYKLKMVPVLEAMILASGFVLRLAAGALAIDVTISHWLLICGFLLALLLAFSKRVPEVSHPTARTPHYPAAFLSQSVTLLAGVTLVSYVLYTVAPDTVAKFKSENLLFTAPIVLFGILRYLFLLTREGSKDPTNTLLSDRPLLITVVVWALLAGVIVSQAGR